MVRDRALPVIEQEAGTAKNRRLSSKVRIAATRKKPKCSTPNRRSTPSQRNLKPISLPTTITTSSKEQDSKIYKPPICVDEDIQMEAEEITETFTMVIVTDKHRIEIEIG